MGRQIGDRLDYFLVLLLLVNTLGTPADLRAATIEAVSCLHADVQAAIDAAADGDTVKIPAGTCTWTETVRLGAITNWNTVPVTVSSKAITIRGAGRGKTTIIDGIPKAVGGNPAGNVLSLLSQEEGLTRLSGLTFDRSNPDRYEGSADPYNVAILAIGGYSQSLRVDNIHFLVAQGHALSVRGSLYGVVDHNIFDLIGWHFGLYVFHPNWNKAQNGDGSWSDALHPGTEKAVFIEDNVFNATKSSVAIDGWAGGRAVFRNNTLNNVTIGNHGTDSGGRLRSMRSMEIYNNIITLNDPARYYYVGQLRGGTFTIFNNTITNRYPGSFVLINYRDFESYSPWGKCDGSSPFDLNDDVTYDTGYHTGVNGSSSLTAAGKTWESNHWAGYHLHNTTKGLSDMIKSNTADTITTIRKTVYSPLVSWDSGDGFKILRAAACLDQRGRGAGRLISGWDPNPKSWPQQEPEATYAWNNTLNGSGDTAKIVSDNPWRMQENRDFFNSPRPDYAPYAYPHPLVAMAASEVPGAPTNLKVSAAP